MRGGAVAAGSGIDPLPSPVRNVLLVLVVVAALVVTLMSGLFVSLVIVLGPGDRCTSRHCDDLVSHAARINEVAQFGIFFATVVAVAALNGSRRLAAIAVMLVLSVTITIASFSVAASA